MDKRIREFLHGFAFDSEYIFHESMVALGDLDEIVRKHSELLAYVLELEDRVDTYYVMWSNVESSMDALKLITNRPKWLHHDAVTVAQTED